MGKRGLNGGPSLPPPWKDSLFDKNNAEVALAPLTLGGGSKPSSTPYALSRRVPAGPQSTDL